MSCYTVKSNRFIKSYGLKIILVKMVLPKRFWNAYLKYYLNNTKFTSDLRQQTELLIALQYYPSSYSIITPITTIVMFLFSNFRYNFYPLISN